MAASGPFCRSNRWAPMKSCTSAMVNGAVLELGQYPVYSPGRKRKKKAMTVMSVIAHRAWSVGKSAVTPSAWCRMATGMGFTLSGGASSFP